MSFAYIEGQEAQALAFFEKQLDQCADPVLRKELELFVEKLRAKIKKEDQTPPQSAKESFSLNNSMVLAAAKVEC
jgi:hypothetical protein